MDLLSNSGLSEMGSKLVSDGGTGKSAAQAPQAWRRHLVGTSRAMQSVYDMIKLLAPRQSTVLIQGETGTGKEKVARALHEASGRKGSLVSLNCTALPETLLESELFGHVKGAFTGATQARKGRFEDAHLGTIFLDEVGDMPLETQAKLLRVLQEREVQRLGSSETIAIDVRVIAATNVNLLESVERGRFRSDLYYRLNVVPIALPTLRERPEDIPALVRHFIQKSCQNEATPIKHVGEETLQRLQEFPWPGNVRELENAVERALTLSGEHTTIEFADFRLAVNANRPVFAPSLVSTTPETAQQPGQSATVPDLLVDGLDFDATIEQLSKRLIDQALRQSNGNKKRAAERLGLKRTTLTAKLRAMSAAS